MSDDDYQHWPDDGELWQRQITTAPGYDGNNGLNSHSYNPSNTPAPQPQPQLQPIYYQQQVVGNPQPQYYSYPAPGYVAYPSQGYYMAVAPQIAQPRVDEKIEHPMPNAWLGRTRAEVEQDNMKLAKREGASEPRKVQPIDVKDTQLFWVIEPDGETSTLRFVLTFRCLILDETALTTSIDISWISRI